MNNSVTPPIAEKQPYEMIKHNDVRVDDYYWMRLTDDQKKAENYDEKTQKVVDYIDNEKTKNPDHTYAMQPIVLKMANSDGYADYTEGLQPDRLIEEDITNLGVLGNIGEPLLNSTLNLISGTKKEVLINPKLNKKFLIIDPLMLERQKMIIEKNINYPLRK